jgi:radical SAM superfamily enzyme YgiQ (UPF0313 family)
VKKLKVLLVQPPISGITVKGRIIEPLALEILAATILPKHEVRILDLRIENKLKETLEDFLPDIVGFTCYICQVEIVRKLAKQTKEFNSNIVTLVGGEQPTHLPEEFNTPCIDYISRGDGDRTFPRLIDAIVNNSTIEDIPGIVKVENGQLVFGAEKEILCDLSKSPIPVRDLTLKYRSFYKFLGWGPVGSLATSRGCNYRCNFCSIWKIRKGVVGQFSLDRVIKELKIIKEDSIYFCEAHSFQDIKYADALADSIVLNHINKRYMMYVRSNAVINHKNLFEKWYKIGLKRVFIGFEAITDERLKGLNKANKNDFNERTIEILHDIGIEIVASFIIDLDFKKEDFEILKKFVLEKNLTMPVYNILTPLPGGSLYDDNIDFLKKVPYSHFDFNHALLSTVMPKKEFYQNIADLYFETYTNDLPKDLTVKLGYTDEMLKSRKAMGKLLSRNIELISEEEITYW